VLLPVVFLHGSVTSKSLVQAARSTALPMTDTSVSVHEVHATPRNPHDLAPTPRNPRDLAPMELLAGLLRAQKLPAPLSLPAPSHCGFQINACLPGRTCEGIIRVVALFPLGSDFC